MIYTDRMRRERKALSRLRRRRLGAPFHSRRRCKHTLLTPEDPDARWKCCPRWHGKLTNKWNSRTFAMKHGCHVPELYWHGTDVDALPFSELPEAYVIRPMWGTALCTGTCVMSNSRNLMNGREYSVDELREELRETTFLRRRRGERIPLMVEEFITDREGEYVLPIEYKCYVFGETVVAIEVNRRLLRNKLQRGAFMPDWTAIPGGILTEYEPLSPDVPRPDCLDEMLACASRLGREVERHVRVDFYTSQAGPVFAELTFSSHAGHGFNAFAEEFFGDQWERAFPVGT